VNPERWEQLKRLFQAAIELDPSERTAFLDTACGADPEMRKEIEALLTEHDSSDDFLDKPVYEAAANLFESDAGNSLVGMQLGPYAITKNLGRGGMGVVYLAEDRRLNRLVALKAIAPDRTQDSEHRERLRREAQAAAKLAHPGIATVHALEEFEGNLYIIYEYVPGENLLSLRGKIGLLPQILMDIAVQIARALAFAHDKGIIHRDLKPENIIQTPEGIVKILDFGLARIQDGDTETASATRLTKAGAFLGTPAYASPEQLLAAPIDFRSDIFSFGILLYEMATGIHPFAAPDTVSTIARILEADAPELTPTSPASPHDLEKIIRRCLRKDPDRRYHSTRELLTDLERLQTKISHTAADSNAPVTQSEDQKSRPAPPSSSLWWWQFHQACVGAVYYLMLYPLWRAKEWTPGVPGYLFFYASLVAVGIAANLRFHLWFTSAFYSAELPWQRNRATPWIRSAEYLYVALLLLGAAAIYAAHAVVTTILITGAIGILVAFVLIEPTTIRAAFGDRPTSAPKLPRHE
jgi:serine/threonine protein kinase